MDNRKEQILIGRREGKKSGNYIDSGCECQERMEVLEQRTLTGLSNEGCYDAIRFTDLAQCSAISIATI